jgi:hypothetical protein
VAFCSLFAQSCKIWSIKRDPSHQDIHTPIITKSTTSTATAGNNQQYFISTAAFNSLFSMAPKAKAKKQHGAKGNKQPPKLRAKAGVPRAKPVSFYNHSPIPVHNLILPVFSEIKLFPSRTEVPRWPNPPNDT